ncbi:MAG: Rpn family recombination-promoting nuclease/putative transposase [Pseudomonadota bacterium]
MALQIHRPHDSLFRSYLSNIKRAKTFFKVYLPEDIQSLCDFSTLKLESGSFVEKNLRQYFSDILYSVQIDGERAYVYPLIEHQTTPRRMTSFQIFGYVYGVMKQHLDKGYPDLPVVVPILYYRGKVTPYPYTGNLFDCFGKQKELAKMIYSRPYSIVDIASMSDDEIRTHEDIAILDFSQKYSALNQDIQDWAENIVEELKKGYLSSEQCQTLLYYTFRDADTRDVKQLLVMLKNIPTYGEDIMSVAQKLEEQGLQKGLQTGLHQGFEKGVKSVERSMRSKGLDRETIQEILSLSKKLEQEKV